jgi:hypothetical protein
MSLTGAAYELLPVKDVDRGAMTGMAQLVHTRAGRVRDSLSVG